VRAVLNQVKQQVEDLRPDGDPFGAPRELPPFRIEA